MASSRLERKNEIQAEDEEVNSSICPVTSQVFKDPVVSSRTGITLEREGARRWHVEFKHNTCPVTRQETTYEDYVPNITLRNFIEESKQQELAKIRLLQNESEFLQQELEKAKKKIANLQMALSEQAILLANSLTKAREQQIKLHELEEASFQRNMKFFNAQEYKPMKTVSIPDCEFLSAVRKQNVDKAKTWLGLGANIQARDAKSGEDALEIARKNNDERMLQMLTRPRNKI